MRATLRVQGRAAWCGAFVLLLVALAACASGAPSGTTAVATATHAPPQAMVTPTSNVYPLTPTPASTPRTVIVMIVLDSSTDILRFSPNTVTIHVGDSVKWVNDTTSPHTSTSDPGDPVSWEGTMMQWHDSYTVRFTVAGTYTYSCAIHPNMAGTVFVTG